MTIAPYYEDDLVTIYHADSIKEHALWNDADVLVTDPPYGMSYQSSKRATDERLARIDGDDSATVRDDAVSIWGGVKPALVFGTWRIDPPAGERVRMVWSKPYPGMGDLRIPWGTSHEFIHLLGFGWDSKNTGHKRQKGVLDFNSTAGGKYGDASKYGHPTPKPVSLMEHLIERCPSGTVADPFAGVGATLVAAKNLGRKAVGVEMSEEYCETAALRLQAIENNAVALAA